MCICSVALAFVQYVVVQDRQTDFLMQLRLRLFTGLLHAPLRQSPSVRL